MQKPTEYDKTQATTIGDYSRPKAGPVVFKIISAKEELSKKDSRPMLVLDLDIAQGEFKGHFKELFDFLKKKNPDVKWPCVHRRCTDGNQVSYFKGDIKAIEESNPGFAFNFDENTLKGKLVGGMLGEKEIDPSGKTILEPRFLCSAEKATSGNLTIPKVKPYTRQSSYTPEHTDSDYTEYESDENLPF